MMKKKLFILALLPLALSGCSLNFSKDHLEDGLNGSGSYVEDPKEIEYFEGDSIKTTSYARYSLSMYSIADLDNMGIAHQDEEAPLGNGLAYEIKNSISDPRSLITVENEYEEISHAKEGLMVGNLAYRYNGRLLLTVTLDTYVKYVEIVAHPRVGTISTETGYEQKIDSHVAINVNDSKYIKLKSDTAYEDTSCKYEIKDNTTKIDIGVYGNRAVIKSINLYY